MPKAKKIKQQKAIIIRSHLTKLKDFKKTDKLIKTATAEKITALKISPNTKFLTTAIPKQRHNAKTNATLKLKNFFFCIRLFFPLKTLFLPIITVSTNKLIIHDKILK